MPIPSLAIQIQRGINGVCIGCGIFIDKRSKRCRACHQRYVMNKRYPPSRRPVLLCIDCGNKVSYQSKKAGGQGRCRSCYFQYRRNNPKPKRPVSRYYSGTSYLDRDGDRRYADEILYDYFTHAGAWASLRKCWKGFKIAKSNYHYEYMLKYANRIQHLALLLNIEPPDFPELEADLWTYEDPDEYKW